MATAPYNNIASPELQKGGFAGTGQAAFPTNNGFAGTGQAAFPTKSWLRWYKRLSQSTQW
jgi:hypothetical protein